MTPTEPPRAKAFLAVLATGATAPLYAYSRSQALLTAQELYPTSFVRLTSLGDW